MTFLSPLIFVGIAVLVGFLSTLKGDQKRIAIHDETGLFASEFKSDDQYRYMDLSSVNVKTLKDSIIAEHYDGLLLIPKTNDNKQLQSQIDFISADSPDVTFLDDVETTIANRITKDNYARAGIDSAAIKNATADVSLNLKKASGEETLKGLNWIKISIGGTFGYLIMMFIVIYGNLVMRSVIEEKTNRIIEIIISSVKPFQLMMGKIVGTSLAGVLQFIIWAVIGVVMLLIASSFFGAQLPSAGMTPEMTGAGAQHAGFVQLALKEIMELPLATLIVAFIVYFIGGYFLYSSFYAAIGAAVDNETDSQQFLFPIIMPLILGVYVGFFTVLNDPHGGVATAFSMIPLTSPIVMLMRIPFGVPWWQLVLSVAILFGTFFLVVWFAAKIYRVGILMYGKKPTYKEIFRWLRY